MIKDNLEKCFGFIIELEKLKAIERRTKPVGLGRYENSAEHSWQIAILAMAMVNFADNPVDMEKVLKMLLLHDICEIDADDVFFFDEAARTAVEEKELAAMKRILGILPTEMAAEFFGIWQEFEAAATREAKFAKAIDRLMPVLQNLYNDGQSWKENGVSKEQILAKTSYISDAGEAIWESIEGKIEAAFESK